MTKEERNRDSSVGIATSLCSRQVRFDPQQGEKVFLLSMAFGPTLWPIQTPVQWAPGSLSPMLKLARHDAHHSPQFMPRLRMAWSCCLTPPYAFMKCCLIKNRHKFHFTHRCYVEVYLGMLYSCLRVILGPIICNPSEPKYEFFS
jgi:hypothetical protein